MSCLLLFSILSIFCSSATPSFPTSEGEMFGFNGETLKLNSNAGGANGKEADNIFSLLSGFQSFEVNKHEQTSQSSALTIRKTEIKVREEDLSANDLDNEAGNESIFPYASMLKNYIQLANRLSDSGSAASDVLEDVVSTVRKVTSIYGNELKKRSNESSAVSLEDKVPYQEGIMASASKVISTLLLPTNMEKIYKMGSQATSEDEILEQLASLIVGSEDRGGGYGGHGGGHYGLTKDPITIIALLALAAYLIRAAIEFLRATKGKRSVPSLDYPELQHLLPDVLSNVYAMIDEAQLKYESNPVEEANDVSSSTWTSFTSDIFKLILLQSKDNKFCFRWQLCNQLNKKSIAELRASDALWIGMGLYSGDQAVLLDVYEGGDEGVSCDRFSQTCSSEDSRDKNCKSCPSNFFNEMKQLKKTFLKNLSGFSSLLNGRT